MAKFRKKPVVIEAVKYLGHGNVENGEVPDWMWDAFEKGTLIPTNGDDPLRVKTLEGTMVVRPSNWIIQGVAGEIYPCKAEIFAATYEEVEAGDMTGDGGSAN